MLESLSDLGSIPTLWTEKLYINFDCDPRCTNVLENLCNISIKKYISYIYPRGKTSCFRLYTIIVAKVFDNGLKFIATRSENVNTVATDNSFSGSRESSDIEQMLRKARSKRIDWQKTLGRLMRNLNML